MPLFNDQHLSNVLWAAALLKLQPPGPWVAAAMAAAARLMKVCACVWGGGEAGGGDGEGRGRGCSWV